VGSPPLSIANRLNNLIGMVDHSPEQVLDTGELLRDVLVETAVSLLPREPEYDWQEPPSLRPNEAAFLRALELDGFTVSGGELRRALPVDVELPGAQSEIDRLIEKHGLSTAKGHLKQALDAHARANWEQPTVKSVLSWMPCSTRLRQSSIRPLLVWEAASHGGRSSLR